MALIWTAKAPGDVSRYTWSPTLADGDTLASYAVTGAGAVIDSDEQDGNDVVVFVSGGTAGTTAEFELTGTTEAGETLTETAYIAIVATTSSGPTARDICDAALRKVTGLGEGPSADQISDAVERLNDMLREWEDMGAGVGATFPIASTTVLTLRDSVLAAVKNGLRIELSDLYGFDVSPAIIAGFRRGLQQIKMANLSDDRAGSDYY